MKKRTISIIMVAIMGIALIGCGDKKEGAENKPPVTDGTQGNNDKKVKLTEDECLALMDEIYNELKAEFAKDGKVDLTLNSDKSRIYIFGKDSNDNSKPFEYSGVKNDSVAVEYKDNGPLVQIKGYFFLNLKDFMDGKVKIELEKTIIQTLYKAINKDGVDLSTFNKEVDEGSRSSVSAGGDETYWDALMDKNFILDFFVKPFGDELEINYTLIKEYK